MTEDPIKEILGSPASSKPVTMEKNPNSEVVVTTVPLVSEIQLTAATGGAEALLLPLHHSIRCGDPHCRDSGHCCGLQLQFPRLHHLHLGSGPPVIWTFFVSFQCLVLEGEAEEQESQETGESDGSSGESEKLDCLGRNETKWDMWPGKLPLPVSSNSPRTRVGENERRVVVYQRKRDELSAGG